MVALLLEIYNQRKINMQRSSPTRRKSLIALFLSNILTKRILNRKKKYPYYNKEDEMHIRAAAGRDGWDEDWFPHETF
jgi:hypothetical protein